jgi:hypothetical protein
LLDLGDIARQLIGRDRGEGRCRIGGETGAGLRNDRGVRERCAAIVRAAGDLPLRALAVAAAYRRPTLFPSIVGIGRPDAVFSWFGGD